MSASDDIRNIGQHMWIDHLSAATLDDGTLEARRDECGVSGVTANPTIFEEAIADGDYDDRIGDAEGEAEDVFWRLAVEDTGRAADIFRSVYDSSGGATGYVSIELSPELAYDAETSVRQGTELFDRIARPNVMVKVPGTNAGIVAIEELIARGVNVNVTLLFGLTQWQAARQAYERGLQRRIDDGLSIDVASVASFFLSRIDDQLQSSLPDDLQNLTALSSAAVVAAEWRSVLRRDEWMRLATAGARPQQLLWASTAPKSSELDELYYVERLVAPDSVITLKPQTLDVLCERSQIDIHRLDEVDGTSALETISRIERQSGPLIEVADELQGVGVDKFAASFDSLIDTIERVGSRSRPSARTT